MRNGALDQVVKIIDAISKAHIIVQLGGIAILLILAIAYLVKQLTPLIKALTSYTKVIQKIAADNQRWIVSNTNTHSKTDQAPTGRRRRSGVLPKGE